LKEREGKKEEGKKEGKKERQERKKDKRERKERERKKERKKAQLFGSTPFPDGARPLLSPLMFPAYPQGSELFDVQVAVR
jgi:hypothetical protein